MIAQVQLRLQSLETKVQIPSLGLVALRIGAEGVTHVFADFLQTLEFPVDVDCGGQAVNGKAHVAVTAVVMESLKDGIVPVRHAIGFVALIAIDVEDGFAILNLVPFGGGVNALLIVFLLKRIPEPSDNHGFVGVWMSGLQAHLEGIVDLEVQEAVGERGLVGEVAVICSKQFCAV